MFRSAFDSGRVLLMDGGMGTQLLRAGLTLGECGVLWNLTRPREVLAVHQAYLDAGAEVLLTNTFLCDPISLARHGLEDRLSEIASAGIRLAREARGGKRFVLASVGPIFSPGRSEEFADRDALGRTASLLTDTDGLLFETCSSPAALSAVQFVEHRVASQDHFPLLLSLTYHRREGELVTASGHRPETFARHAIGHGVAALGVNCGKEIDFADVAEILRRYREETDLPLFARPNAGTPTAEGRYPRSPEALASAMAELIASGASMLGGCCGTTPEHISAMRESLRSLAVPDAHRPPLS